MGDLLPSTRFRIDQPEVAITGADGDLTREPGRGSSIRPRGCARRAARGARLLVGRTAGRDDDRDGRKHEPDSEPSDGTLGQFASYTPWRPVRFPTLRRGRVLRAVAGWRRPGYRRWTRPGRRTRARHVISCPPHTQSGSDTPGRV